jgi:putative membrane protein
VSDILTPADLDRIAVAVTEAEGRTTGEIACVLTEEVSDYPEVPLAWGALAALVAPPLGIAAGLAPMIETFGPAGWSIGHASALQGQIVLALTAYVALQVVLFAAVAGLAFIPAVRRVLTPTLLKRRKTERAARHQFGAIAAATGETGAFVMIFVSRRDRQVQVLAGPAIHDKAGQGPWDAAADAVRAGMRRAAPADGLLDAVRLCGDALAAHFPGSHDDENRIANRPVEL